MSRSALSRPMAVALADQLLPAGTSIFDYGCGRGDDLKRLQELGFVASGWDPNHRPNAQICPADVVNLGYVINVIERVDERAETLRRAWGLAKDVLVVSARLTWDARDLAGRPLSDGLLTKTGTFQRFYEQHELATWIEQTLGAQPHAAAPGIYYVFRDASRAQQYLANRISSYRPRLRIDPHAVYDTHREELAPLLEFLNDHARPPKPGELAAVHEHAVLASLGSIGRGVRLIRQVTQGEHWEQVADHRRAELRIYIALSRFGRRPRLTELGETLALDIKSLFGSYREACTEADRLLLACGDPALIFVVARSSKIGKQTPTALYVHRTALGELPPVLQVYEGCARVLAGTVEGANLIKLSVREPQVSYLCYPNFDADPHPTLAAAVTVNLRRLSVDWRSYLQSDNPPLLHRKEEFLSANDPHRAKYSALTRSELRAGLYEHPERIGTVRGWQNELTRHGRSLRGHRLVRA